MVYTSRDHMTNHILTDNHMTCDNHEDVSFHTFKSASLGGKDLRQLPVPSQEALDPFGMPVDDG